MGCGPAQPDGKAGLQSGFPSAWKRLMLIARFFKETCGQDPNSSQIAMYCSTHLCWINRIQCKRGTYNMKQKMELV